jgi:hypothetical protein
LQAEIKREDSSNFLRRGEEITAGRVWERWRRRHSLLLSGFSSSLSLVSLKQQNEVLDLVSNLTVVPAVWGLQKKLATL